MCVSESVGLDQTCRRAPAPSDAHEIARGCPYSTRARPQYNYEKQPGATGSIDLFLIYLRLTRVHPQGVIIMFVAVRDYAHDLFVPVNILYCCYSMHGWPRAEVDLFACENTAVGSQAPLLAHPAVRYVHAGLPVLLLCVVVLAYFPPSLAWEVDENCGHIIPPFRRTRTGGKRDIGATRAHPEPFQIFS